MVGLTPRQGERVVPASPILARIGITPDEWAAFRKDCIDRQTKPSQLLAELVRRHLKGRK